MTSKARSGQDERRGGHEGLFNVETPEPSSVAKLSASKGQIKEDVLLDPDDLCSEDGVESNQDAEIGMNSTRTDQEEREEGQGGLLEFPKTEPTTSPVNQILHATAKDTCVHNSNDNSAGAPRLTENEVRMLDDPPPQSPPDESTGQEQAVAQQSHVGGG